MKRPALPVVPADRVILAATPEPPLGVVAWNMNTSCNYRCTYCTQRFLDDRTRWAADVPRFLDGFAQLARATSARWEVKLSGGEPFLHPHFTEVVRGLRGQQTHPHVRRRRPTGKLRRVTVLLIIIRCQPGVRFGHERFEIAPRLAGRTA